MVTVALCSPPVLGAKVTKNVQLAPTMSEDGQLFLTENWPFELTIFVSVSGAEPAFVNVTAFVLDADGL
jgi:hypothetical protein